MSVRARLREPDGAWSAEVVLPGELQPSRPPFLVWNASVYAMDGVQRDGLEVVNYTRVFAYWIGSQP